jgi:hypothetical protein
VLGVLGVTLFVLVLAYGVLRHVGWSVSDLKSGFKPTTTAAPPTVALEKSRSTDIAETASHEDVAAGAAQPPAGALTNAAPETRWTEPGRETVPQTGAAGVEAGRTARDEARESPQGAPAASERQQIADSTLTARRTAARRDSLRLIRVIAREDSVRRALLAQAVSDSLAGAGLSTSAPVPAESAGTPSQRLPVDGQDSRLGNLPATEVTATSQPASSAQSAVLGNPPAIKPDAPQPDAAPRPGTGAGMELPAAISRDSSDLLFSQPAESLSSHSVTEARSVLLPARVDTFVVHLSSFRLLNEAETEVARFRSMGISARYLRVPVEDMGTWYRVITGRFATFAQAESLALHLEATGTIAHAHVIGRAGWGEPVPIEPKGVGR